jgi:hypothetical protein
VTSGRKQQRIVPLLLSHELVLGSSQNLQLNLDLKQLQTVESSLIIGKLKRIKVWEKKE